MKLFLTAWAVLILCVSARAADCFLTLFATDSGWYTPANYHDPDNNNYLVGYHAAGATEFRDWFVFDLPPSVGPIQSVELRLFAFTINSTNAETFELYHVATPVSTLVAGAGPTITRVFTDLGDGTLYASRAVSVSEANNYITILLNSNAVAAIAAAGGQRFALGGKLSSISPTPTSDESLFSFSSGTSPNVQLIVTFAGAGVPLILQQPPPLVLLSGGSNTNIPVTACGPGTLRYQWFFNNSALTNQTNASLSLVNVNASRVGDYYVVVTNTSGATTSSIARIYVDAAAPVLQSGAFPYRTFPIGYTADFYSYANGNPAPHFQWQFNGVNIPGATNDYLPLPNVQASQAGTYTFVASNIFGAVSTNMFLTVEPLIVYLDASVTVETGNDTYYPSYVESSVPVTYQWRIDGTNIPGANGAYLSLFNANQPGTYDLVVANSYGVRTSGVAIVNVYSSAPSLNLSFSIAWPLVGSDILLSATASGTRPLSFQWYFNNVPISGETNLQLLLQNVSSSDVGTYRLVASNMFADLTREVVVLPLTVEPPVIVASFGVGGEAFEGDALHLTPIAYGGPPPALQWRFNGVDIPSATNTTLLLTNLSAAQNGSYVLTATNSFGSNTFEAFVNVKPRRALDRWTWRNSRPQANDLKHMAFGNGRTVAVGERGSIVSSTNGIDWTVGSIGQQYLVSHIAFGNGLFAVLAERFSSFAGGYSLTFYTSPDGISWTARDIPLAFPQSLDFANGEFLMTEGPLISSHAPKRLARSVNGLAWQVTPMLGPSIVPSGIKYGNGTYVAVSGYEICTSRDRVHWTQHYVPGNIIRLTFANGLFIASARYGEIWTSSDGAHWSARNPGIARFGGMSGDVNGLAYGNGFFVAVGDDGVITRSPNANVWAQVSSTTSQNLRDVVFDGTKFIACGNSGVLLTSPNSVTWTDRRIGRTKDLYGIIYTNDQFVAVGYEGTILTSPDGNMWTTRTSPNSRDLHAVTHGGGQYVAVGRRGTVLTSPDAITWTSRATPTTNYLQRVAWGNGRFVVTGEDATILSSTNAIDWQQHTASVPANTQMEGVAYGKGVFVIVGGYFASGDENANSIMLVSSNGITWSNVSYNLGVIARGVTFGFNGFLTVGNDGNVILSGDGLAWSFPFSVAPYQNLRHIKVAAGRAVAVGNEGTIISSSNGYNWQIHASVVSHNLHDVAYGAGKFVAVGNAGAIVQSDDVLPVFSAPRFSNGAMRFNLRGGMEPEYDVESSENLSSWSQDGVFTNNGSTVSFTVSTNGPLRFFRVRAP